jgi:hypothetical protein
VKARLHLIVAVVVVMAALFLLRMRGGDRPRHQRESAPSQAARSKAAGEAPAATPTKSTPAKSFDRKKRDRLEKAIAKARERRLQAPPEKPTLDSKVGKESTALNLANKTGEESDWEARQTELINELFGECLDLAKEDGPVEGELVFLFAITGEPEVGGIVHDVRFVEERSTNKHRGLRECMQESVYALELEPPPEGMKVSRMVSLRLDEEARQ